MSTINDSDQFIVQRGTTSHKQSAKDLMSTIQDTDLMLIQRGTASYKVTCEDVKDQLGGGGSAFSTVDISPLTITPEISEQIITVTTDIKKVDGSVPADVLYVWYQYDEATGTEGQVELKRETTRESTSTLVLPASAAGKFIGCSVAYLAVIIDETQRCAVGTPAGPVADMHGLRFDAARTPSLSRTLGAGDQTTFTWSGWVKNCGQSNSQQVIFSAYSGSGSNYSALDFRDNCLRFVYYPGSIQAQLKTAATFNDPSEWIHVVLIADTTSASESSRIKLYVNGVEPALQTASYPDQNAGLYFNGDRRHLFGLNANSDSPSAPYSGYLSDCYFVDNKTIPPTAFGHQYAQGWGPKDSTEVIESIDNWRPDPPSPSPGPGAAGQPYDRRANTDQVWSSGTVTGTFDAAWGGITAAFNGVISNTDIAKANSNNTASYTFASPITCSTLKVHYQAESGAGTAVTTIKGSLNDVVLPNTGAGVVELAEVNVATLGNLVGFECASATSLSGVAGFEVDGRLLVDQGVWSLSSDVVDKASYSEISDSMFLRAFDGNEAESAQADQGKNPIATWPEGVIGNGSSDKVEVLFLGNVTETEINGTNRTITIGTYFEVPEKKLTSLQFRHPGGGQVCNPAAVKVNDVILVYSGAQWNTSQVWSNLNNGKWQETFPLTNAFNGVINSSESEGGADFYGAKPPFGGDYASVGPIPTKVTTGADKDISELEIDIYITASVPQDAILWNGGNIGSIPSTAGVHKLKKTINTTSTVTLEFKADTTSQYAYLRGITACYADGSRELLVDGSTVWNTSQRWSDALTYDASKVNSAVPVSNIFDGTTNTWSSAKPAETVLLTFDTPIPFTQLALSYGSGADPSTVKVNGVTLPNQPSWNGGRGFTNVSDVAGLTSPLTTIEYSSTAGGSGDAVAGVMVNGALLVDAAPTWNSSQVWSDSLTITADPGFASNQGVEKGFDGDATTKCGVRQGLGNTLTVDGLTSVTTGAAQMSVTIDYGKPNELKVFHAGGEWTTTSTASPIDIGPNVTFPVSKLVWTCTEETGAGGFNQIKVNNKILVDAGFGNNGFYLPFDPAQTGAIYSNNSSSSGTISGTPQEAFDGQLSSPSMGFRSTEFVKFEFDNAVPNSGTIEVIYYGSRNGVGSVIFNEGEGDEATVPVNAGGVIMDYKVIATNSSIASLKNIKMTSAGETMGIAGIRVDGSLLVDHSSIGVDMSGSNNNFHDENFNVADTLDNSADWTSQWSVAPEVTPGRTADKMYDGAPAPNMYQTTADGVPAVWNVQKTGITKIEAKVEIAAARIAINDGAFSAFSLGWKTIYSGSSIDNPKIEIKGDNDSISAYISGWKINGELLINSTLSTSNLIDTVLDTPMKNYAVLDSSKASWGGEGGVPTYSNGNLVAVGKSGSTSSAISTQGVSSGKIYFEVTLLAAHDDNAAVIGLNKGNTSKSAIGLRPSGTLDSLVISSGSAFSYDVGDTVGIAFEPGVSVSFYGKDGDTFSASLEAGTWYPWTQLGGNTVSVAHNHGQQPFVHTPPAGYEGLYQIWSQWVGYLLTARLAEDEERISYLEQVIIDQSVPFERQATYEKGAIVDIGGELFEAQVNNADVTAADFVARLLKDGSSEWMKLDIRTREKPNLPSPEPPPEPEPTPEPPPSGGSTTDALFS